MNLPNIYRINQFIQATVWFAFGLYGKILAQNGRHEQIIEQIFGVEDFSHLIKPFGVAEIFLGFWVMSGFYSKETAVLQIVLILSMNIIEQILAPDLLVFGRINLLFALCFALFIYYNEFILKKKIKYAI